MTMGSRLLLLIWTASFPRGDCFRSIVTGPAASSSLNSIANASEPSTQQGIRAPKPTVYKHLFRHYGDISFDSWLRCQDPLDFLQSVGCTFDEIRSLQGDCPNLLDQNVHDQLAPLVRFLVETMDGGTGRLTWSNDDEVEAASVTPEQLYYQSQANEGTEIECLVQNDEMEDQEHHSMRLFESTKELIKGNFFGCRLDRTLGPFHAYLESHDLPHGKVLLQRPQMWEQLLTACQSKSPTMDFAILCMEWKKDTEGEHTFESVKAFCEVFSAGILPVAKGLSSPSLIDAQNLIHLMLRHGANPLEYDQHGIVPLFWAAGRGDLEGFQSLLASTAIEHDYGDSIYDTVDLEREPKQGATALHWASCGMSKDYIGTGGSFDVCRWILEQAGEAREKVANLETWKQSTPLMWASWAGNLAIVDLLVVHGAKITHMDSNGRNAMHLAAAAGHAGVVDYFLRTHHGVEMLNACDMDGRTPLDYAKNYGRRDVMECLVNSEMITSSPVPISATGR